MSRRTAATIRRPEPHLYRQDPDAPGTCVRCHLIKANDVHVDQLPDNPDAAAHDRAVLGEKDED
jgi:hypothetical protein